MLCMVLCGVALTVVNVMWMARLGERLDRTLGVVRDLRRKADGSGASSMMSSESPVVGVDDRYVVFYLFLFHEKR
jgi:hypothetical protein